jgi:EmrB/QacA subfamily drug resistance transporter
MSDAESHGHRHLGLALAVICTVQLMVVLDASIVNVALPSIQRALRFSGANLEWVINGYTLAFGGLLLLGGRTGDLFGRRRMFVIGVGVFTLASLVGGFATTQGWLVAARVVQGVGAAIASPTALSLIASTFPEGTSRDRAMGVYAGMSAIGAAVGLLVGGVLTDVLSWRWVLFVNVPIGLGVMFAAPRVLGETETHRGRLDLPGALSVTAGMSLLVYGFVHAAGHGWGSSGTLGPLVAAVAILVAFVVVETRTTDPIMPLDIFANRNRAGGYAVMLAIGTALFSMFYFVTLFIQQILGYSPIQAGLAFLPFAATMMVFAGASAQLVGRTGPKRPMVMGTLLLAAGLLWLSQADAGSSYAGGLLGPMMVMAAGGGSCFVPLTLIAVSRIRQDEAGIASALLNTSQQVGGALGLALLGTIAATATRHRISDLGGALGGQVGAALAGQHGPAGGGHLAPAVRDALDQATVHGYSSAFRVGACLALAAFVLVLTTIRWQPGDAVAADVVAPHA